MLASMTDKQKQLLGVGGVVSAAALAVAVTEQPAQADAVADVSAQVTSLGTLAAAALVVALTPFGIYFAFKIVRKVLSGT